MKKPHHLTRSALAELRTNILLFCSRPEKISSQISIDDILWGTDFIGGNIYPHEVYFRSVIYTIFEKFVRNGIMTSNSGCGSACNRYRIIIPKNL